MAIEMIKMRASFIFNVTVIKMFNTVITLCSLASMPFYPTLVITVPGVLYVFAGEHRVLTFERPVSISGMRDVSVGCNLSAPVKPLRALPPAIRKSERRRRRFELHLLQFGDPRV